MISSAKTKWSPSKEVKIIKRKNRGALKRSGSILIAVRSCTTRAKISKENGTSTGPKRPMKAGPPNTASFLELMARKRMSGTKNGTKRVGGAKKIPRSQLAKSGVGTFRLKRSGMKSGARFIERMTAENGVTNGRSIWPAV